MTNLPPREEKDKARVLGRKIRELFFPLARFVHETVPAGSTGLHKINAFTARAHSGPGVSCHRQCLSSWGKVFNIRARCRSNPSEGSPDLSFLPLSSSFRVTRKSKATGVEDTGKDSDPGAETWNFTLPGFKVSFHDLWRHIYTVLERLNLCQGFCTAYCHTVHERSPIDWKDRFVWLTIPMQVCVYEEKSC